MTNEPNRREFLADVGKGMVVASVGTSLAGDLGLNLALADEGQARLSFGEMESLAALMQDTEVDGLQPLLVERIRGGTTLHTLVTAGALANARSFGGQDYVGYHALMAMMPAYQIAREMSGTRRALPVLKVLYRNTSKIRENGGRSAEVLRQVEPQALRGTARDAEQLREHMRGGRMDDAERLFAHMARGKVTDLYNQLQLLVQDDLNVHRVVLAWRSWDLLGMTGMDHAHTMLRQVVRYCVDEEQMRIDRGRPQPRIREALPKLFSQYKLLEIEPGSKRARDEEIRELARTVYGSGRERAAEAAAAALAGGWDPEDVGEAVSLAANQLVLRDPGRQHNTTADKPRGSVHGASVGVHASDAANAWRHIARVTDTRNCFASLVVAAYHTAGQQGGQYDAPYPHGEHLGKITATTAEALRADLDSAVRHKDQGRACAVVQRYGELGHPADAIFEDLRKYAVSEDGALHAEKYYRTIREEFAVTRPAFRQGHLVALARVTASEYGYPAPGREQAEQLLT